MYRKIDIWKTIEGHAPNCGVEIAQENKRLGRKIKVPALLKNGRQAIQTLREDNFRINAARLFNMLPSKIRNIKHYQEDFKIELDIFLSTIPDQPKMGDLTPTAVNQVTGRQSNSLLAWATT